MADNVRQSGFRWVSSYLGAKQPNIIVHHVATAYQASVAPGPVNCDIWPGDPVNMVNDGSLKIAAAGESILGIVADIKEYWDGSVMAFGNKLPGGTAYGTVLERQSKIGIIPVAGQLFEIDCDDAVTATTEAAYQALIHENCDHVFAPVTADKRAYPMLDIATHVATTAQWRIVGISRRVSTNTDFAGNYVKLLVTCNEVQNAPFVTAGL
jgi:hypothetical protein